MERGRNTTTSNTLRRITPNEWGTAHDKRTIVEQKYVLMERKIHWWGPRIVDGVRQLEEGYQQVFMPPEIVAKKEKQGWYRVEDNFDVEEALRKDERILDADGNDAKRKSRRVGKSE